MIKCTIRTRNRFTSLNYFESIYIFTFIKIRITEIKFLINFIDEGNISYPLHVLESC